MDAVRAAVDLGGAQFDELQQLRLETTRLESRFKRHHRLDGSGSLGEVIVQSCFHRNIPQRCVWLASQSL